MVIQASSLWSDLLDGQVDPRPLHQVDAERSGPHLGKEGVVVVGADQGELSVQGVDQLYSPAPVCPANPEVLTETSVAVCRVTAVLRDVRLLLQYGGEGAGPDTASLTPGSEHHLEQESLHNCHTVRQTTEVNTSRQHWPRKGQVETPPPTLPMISVRFRNIFLESSCCHHLGVRHF